jgi:arylsulfatase A-like enzyme
MSRPIHLFLAASLVVFTSCGSDDENIQGDLGALALRTDSSSEESGKVQSVKMIKPTRESLREWRFNECEPSFKGKAAQGVSVSLKPQKKSCSVKIPCDIQPASVNQVVLNMTLGEVTNIRVRFKAGSKVLCTSEAFRQPVMRTPEPIFLGMPTALSLDSACDSIELIFSGVVKRKASHLFGVDLMWVPPASVLPMVNTTPSTGGPIDLGGEFRMGLCLSSGVPAKALAQIPSRAELRFSFGIPRQALFANLEGGLEVTLSAEGVGTSKRTIPLESLSSWNDVRLDLDSYVGKSTSLEFLFRGKGPANALLALSTPRVVQPKSEPRHVVLITSDTHRGDHLGAANSGIEIRTPFLDELAKDGVFFEDCMSTANITVPSHAAMMTGNSPRAMGLIENMTALSPSSVTLAEHFRDAGYYTVSVLSTKHLRHDNSGLGQGFDRVISTDREKQLGHVSTEIIRDVIGEEGDQPCFIWLHVFDAHAPYLPPDEYRHEYYPEDRNPYTQGTGIVDGGRARWDPRIRDLEFVLAQYRSEITYLDETLGALFGEPEFDDAIIAFTADHGECLGTHGIFFKHAGLYSDTVDIPLILRWPDCPAGVRVKAPVQNVNLGRTLLDLAGLEAKEFPGVSLVESLSEGAASPPRFAIGAHGHCAAVENDGWLCVLTLQSKGVPNARKHQVELFNLQADPGCLVDLVDVEFEQAKQLRSGLIEWLSAARIEGMAVSRAQHSVELLEAIAALGYATESGGSEGPYYEEDPDDEWCKRFK